MSDIDSLQIEISSSSKDAGDSITALSSNLVKLNRALNKIDTNTANSKMSSLSLGIKDVGGAINSINPKNLENLATVVDKVGRNVRTVAQEASKATTAINSIPNIGDRLTIHRQDIPSLQSYVDGLEQLKKDISDAYVPNGDNSFFGRFIENTKTDIESLKSLYPEAEGLIKDYERVLSEIQNYSWNQKPAEAPIELDAIKRSATEIPALFADIEKGVEGVSAKIKAGSADFNEYMTELMQAAKEARSTMKGMESGKIAFDAEKYGQLANGLKYSNEELKRYKDSLKETDGAMRNISDAFEKAGENAQKTSGVLSSAFDGFAKIYAFGGTVGSVAGVFGNTADKLNGILVKLYSFDPEEGIVDFLKLPTKILPILEMVEEKIKSKLSGIKEAFSDMGKTAMGVFNKMENFFAKIGQRFTFTLLRKAINAVIKDLNDAMVSLANFSGTTGREFNSAMSSMAASAKWLGASIVGAFAPLVSAISPYIDALISKLVEAIRVIGMFFAALTGKGTIAVANKGMTKFGASTEKAAKSAKKLQSYLLGIDELNVFEKNDNDSGSGGGGGGTPYDWEEVEIPDWLKNLADKFRDILEKLLAPIKEAWDRTKNYVISGFKYMIGELGRLIRSIGRDFLEMWNEEATIRMLENIFRIIGDIEYTIGNLAKRFREAWDEGRVGLHIFEHIRDIVATLIQHLRNVTKYMRDWSDTLNFRPMLHTFDELLVSLNKGADFIGGVFEDVMKNIVFKYIKWMIEEGIPHLNHTIKSIIDAFDFSKIREDLVPLEEAIEKILESLDEGFVNAVGNVGRALAEWTNSEEFSQFLEDIAGILNRITPERIEKFFTALGYAILDIIKALAKFVHSNAFQNFLDKLLSWFDKASAKDMAKVISGIAGAIAAFKFVAFVGTGFKNFLQFIAIAKVADLGGGFKKLSSVFSSLDKPMESLVKGTNSLLSGFKSVSSEIAVVTPAFSRLKGVFSDFSTGIANMGSQLSGFAKAMIGIGAGVLEITLVSSAFKDLAKGAENAGADIIKIIAGIGAAWLAFSLVFESTVVGAIIAGIVALGAALKGVSDAMEEIRAEELATKTSTAFELMNTKVTESKHTFEDYGNSMREVGASMNETFEQMHDKFTIVQDAGYSVRQTVDTISGIGLAMQASADLTESEVARLGASYETLKQQMQDWVNASYDAVVQEMLLDAEYLKSKGEWNDQIAAQYAKRMADLEIARQKDIDSNNELIDSTTVAKDAYVEAVSGYENAVSQYGEASSEADAARIKAEEAYNALLNANMELVGGYAGITDGTDEFNSALESSTQKIRDYAGDVNWAATGIFEGGETTEEASEKITQASEKISSALGSAVSDMQTEYDSMRDAHDRALAELKISVEATKMSEEEKRQAIADGTKRIDGEWKEYVKVYEDNLRAIQEDAYGALEDLMTALDEADMSPAMMQQSMDTFVEAVFGDNPEGFQGKWKKACSDAELNLVPVGQESANKIAESIFQTGTVYGGGFTLNEVTYGIVDGWKTVMDNTISEVKGYAEEKGGEIDEGLGEGIENNSEKLRPPVTSLFSTLDAMMHDNPAMPFGSPNIKAKEYGLGIVEGLNLGIEENMGLTYPFIETWMQSISTTIAQWVDTIAAETFPNFLSVETWQPIFDSFLENVLGIHFEELKTWLDEKLLELVGVDFWQPYFDTLMKEVFQVNFDNFRSWFTEDAITPWWEEDLLPWFAVDKWNAEIIEPVDETIRTHIEDFIKFWQDKVKKWFQDDVEPWFKKERWNTYGLNMKEGIYGGFKGIVQSVGGVINGLIDVFNNGIENIVNAVNSLIDSFNTLAGALGLPSIGSLTAPKIPRITIPSFYNGGFTPYGNPSSYSLFAAGENGVAEMVGQVGGRPAVASNEEITGIRDAVNESGYRQEELLGQIINIATALLNKDPILIGDRQIAEANRRGESLLGMAIIS